MNRMIDDKDARAAAQVRQWLTEDGPVHVRLTGNVDATMVHRLRLLGVHVGQCSSTFGLWDVCFLPFKDPGCKPDRWTGRGQFTEQHAREVREYALSIIYGQFIRLCWPYYTDCEWHDKAAIIRVDVVESRMVDVAAELAKLQRCEVMMGHRSICVAGRTYAAYATASACLRRLGFHQKYEAWMRSYVEPDGIPLIF